MTKDEKLSNLEKELCKTSSESNYAKELIRLSQKSPHFSAWDEWHKVFLLVK